ncbi:glycosyltransferase family 4 protein [Halorubrum salinarum]|uniref:Glycosyltransferase family 4 protein n=1 Tax=Halorubrum salinarum TaxID=2739057 RepID=A0A7D3XT90_9EURY|nr:glycosyltransferase family 4 protein [Halorubrum salinarum]QKG92049.1 glycosyltransferase family 4 protein [Halorubrum salinarum]
MNESNSFEPLNILLLAEDFYPQTSGGAFEDWSFSKSSVQRGHQVTVHTTRTSGEPKIETVQGVKICRFYQASSDHRHPNSIIGIFRRLLFLLFITVRLAYEVTKTDYDVIYSTNHLLHPTAKIVGLLHRIPVVNLVAYSPSERTELHPLNFRNIFEFVIFSFFMGSVVLCRTPRIRTRVDKWSRSTVKLVHGIIEEPVVKEATEANNESIRRELGISPQELLVVSVCRLVPVKRPDEAVKTLSKLPESYQLVVLGDGEYRSVVEETVLEFDIDDRVELLGRRPHDETLRTIFAADVLIVTSLVEAYPTVVFEALSLNTPVVSTPVGILPEIDHPKLKLTDLSSMPQTVLDIGESSEYKLDEETAYQFSIERFTESVLDVIAIATGRVNS